MSLRTSEIEMVMTWVGIKGEDFVKEENSEILKLTLTFEQILSLIQYSYDMGVTDGKM